MTPRIMLKFLAVGLLNLCDHIEQGNIKTNTIIRGNTYYMSERTLIRFGFEVRNMNVWEWILFMQNYPELCLLQSLSYRRFSLVSLKNAKIVTVKAEHLLARKDRILSMINKLDPEAQIHLKIAEVA
jgi:hypothetical protein